MKDVVSKLCEEPDCPKHPAFNFIGESRPRFCNKHKKPNMINVVSKRCAYSGCGKIPNFNFVGQRAKFCATHKKNGMIDVVNKRCEVPGCGKHSKFNLPGEKIGKFCDTHKKPGMKRITRDRCEHQECGIRPVFNFNGETKGRFCDIHKEIGMVDVISKKCNQPGCKTQVSYGFLFSQPTKCAEHKNPNMFFKTQLNPVCQHSFEELCSNHPFYAPPNTTYPTHCEDHTPSDYVNIVEKNCEGCGDLYYIPNDRNKCEICRDDKAQEKIEKAREMRIKTILKNHKIPIKTHDRVPEGGCSQNRPDFVINHPYFPIIVEVDEKQHKAYPGICDVTRMIQLHQDFGENIVFIRYNPDSYINRSGKKQKGFQQNPNREKRLISLIKQLLQEEKLDQPLSAYYLFYNGDDGVDRVIDMDYDNYYSDYRPLVKKLETERKGLI
jgi:hypothetical protein